MITELSGIELALTSELLEKAQMVSCKNQWHLVKNKNKMFAINLCNEQQKIMIY